MHFRSLTEESEAFFKANPRLPSVVRAVSAAYQGEQVDECTVIEVAKDLERSLKIVAETKEIRVHAMRFEVREAGRYVDPLTRRTFAVGERVLVEISAGRPGR